MKKISEQTLSRNPAALLKIKFPYSDPLFRLEDHVIKNLPKTIKPELLWNLEKVHPVLTQYTDHRWKQFCQKRFALKKLEENECYKEMYNRCFIEEREKLSNLSAKITDKENKKASLEKKSRFTTKMEEKKKSEHWTEGLKNGGKTSSPSSINKTTHSMSATKGRLTEARKLKENKTKGGLFAKSMRQFHGSLYKYMKK